MTARALLLVLALVASKRTDDGQTRTVRDFFGAIRSKTPTIAMFQRLFGNDSEAEMNTILAVHFPGEFSGGRRAPDEEVAEFTRKRLSDSKHRSEFLTCLGRLRPRLFIPDSKVAVGATVGGSDHSFQRRAVTTRAGTLTFVFATGSTTIEDIELPDGKSVYSLIPECGLVKNGQAPR